MSIASRINSLVPIIDGVRTPKYIRLYDNGGKSCDQYTAVFTGNYVGRDRLCHYIGFYTPKIIWMHGESDTIIDRPMYSHLGKKIKFSDLPAASQEMLMEEYLEMWGISPSEIGGVN
jgi:hypothetical protein